MDEKHRVGHLAQAEQHVAEGEVHLARQRALIAELERDGHDTTAALELLREFERSQAAHVDGRNRILAELSGSSRQR